MPIFCFLREDEVLRREVPPADAFLLPGVVWGRPDVLFTPAYWMTQYWMREGILTAPSHGLGQTLEEEVVACLLGGHGIPAEVGLAAFERLRGRGLISASCAERGVLAENLREPLVVSGRQVTYRFWSQKAGYIASALRGLSERPAPNTSPLELREHLMLFPGIGPKTASWVVRNWLDSNDVAILDVHVVRAGRLMGLYSLNDRPDVNYFEMERRFLDLASAMGAPASDLDALIWSEMRQTPRLVARALGPRRGWR
jgi:N-glycosylase/DNA lyase